MPQNYMELHLRTLSVEFRKGRADAAPELHLIRGNMLMEVNEATKEKEEWRRQGKKVRDYWVEFEGGAKKSPY